MAKKPRTAKQKAATKKMIAANKRGKKPAKRSPKKKPTRRKKPMARRKKTRKRNGWSMPSLLGLGAGLYAMHKLNMIAALSDVINGRVARAAGKVITAVSNPANMIGAAIIPIGVVMARRTFGPVPLFQAGKVKVRLL